MTAVTIDVTCHELSGAPWLEPCPDAEQVAVLTAAREPFVHTSLANRVVFGWGTAATVAEEVARLGIGRALVVATPGRTAAARDLLDRLGPRGAGLFTEAAMHTPVEVTERALGHMAELGADGVVAQGGGSVTGLAKALALRTGCRQVVLPTTYAGSEVTPLLGQTEAGVKTTIRDPKVLPETVIYDVELTLSLPWPVTVASAMNALAHAVEALYAEDRDPIASLMAAEGARALIRALPRIQADPADRPGRADALYGAWLAGAVLASVGMALHHKLCHVLGGSFDLPHAETHAVILPHAIAFNARAVPDLLRPIAEALGQPDRNPGQALHAFAKRLGAPLALKDLGMPAAGLDQAADLATRNPYWNPRPFERQDIRRILAAAYEGRPPEG